MIPAVGTRWYARDGRVMTVLEVVIPRDPAAMPWCRMKVENAGKRMRRVTEMNVGNFGTDLTFGFLRPALKSPSLSPAPRLADSSGVSTGTEVVEP
jgi:hypothetical protein